MAKQYDAMMKQLIDQFAQDWSGFLCEQLELPPGTNAEPMDADLSTVASQQCDKLFRLSSGADGYIHLEIEAHWTDDLSLRVFFYNSLADYRYGGPVRSIVVLLRRDANARSHSQEWVRVDEKGEYLRFRYRIIKLWELPYKRLMTGPLGILPLALLTDDAVKKVPDLIDQIDERLHTEATSQEQASQVLTACNILLGLRYDKVDIARWFTRVRGMKESVTYMAILEEGAEMGRVEGKVETLRQNIRRLASKRFGKPTKRNQKALKSVKDPDRLQRIHDRILDVIDWADLLDTP